MATYCYKCPVCDQRLGLPTRSEALVCGPCFVSDGEVVYLKRDYKSENVGAALVQLKRERERGGPSAVRDLFLPTAKDFQGPGDPDGAKGLRTWADEHEPKMGNKKPLYPEGIPRRSW